MHDMVSKAFSCVKYLWLGGRNTGWYLNFLAVDPAYQDQGYGRTLAAWGVKQAKQDSITASVVSSPEKVRFYRRCGFEVESGRVSDGEGNPMKGKIEGGVVLFRDPKVE